VEGADWGVRLISRLWGGLGNQLFIYASSATLAEKLRMPIRFDLTAFRNDAFERKYALCDLGIEVAVASRWESFNFWGGPRLRRFIAEREGMRPVERRRYVRELTKIDSHLLECQVDRRWLYIEGYWQDFRFFDHTRVRLLRLAKNASAGLLQGRLAEHRRPLLGIHVRQQLDQSATGIRVCDLKPVLDRDYYLSAADVALRQMPGANVLLFGDDIQFRRNLADTIRAAHSSEVQIMEGYSAASDLMNLAACEALVLSSSTFAWWAGYLNPAAQIVIHPGIDNHGNPFAVPPNWRILRGELPSKS
jgi:hypothetical protein